MLQKSTRPANPGDSRKWFLVDAKDQVLGRLAVVIANKLRAKDTPAFDPSVDAGAFVIVINAAQVKLTGKKEEQKEYQRYSGFRGGLKTFTRVIILRAIVFFGSMPQTASMIMRSGCLARISAAVKVLRPPRKPE